MSRITYQGPGRKIVRKATSLANDPDWADPAVSIPEDDSTWVFWGVVPMRAGGIGALKQLKLEFVFMDAGDVEIGGVTFSYYTFDVVTRQELAMRKPTARPFVRKTGGGAGFLCAESMIVDVNGTSAMGVRLSSIVDASGLATQYIVVATECEFT